MKIPKEYKTEAEHLEILLIKKGIPRCLKCKKNMIKVSEYEWKFDCDCNGDLRLSIG